MDKSDVAKFLTLLDRIADALEAQVTPSEPAEQTSVQSTRSTKSTKTEGSEK